MILVGIQLKASAPLSTKEYLEHYKFKQANSGIFYKMVKEGNLPNALLGYSDWLKQEPLSSDLQAIRFKIV